MRRAGFDTVAAVRRRPAGRRRGPGRRGRPGRARLAADRAEPHRAHRRRGTVVIDARDLSFIDHKGLIQLVEHVRRQGATTTLRVGGQKLVRSLAGMLRLPDLRVVS